ncbi:hypothetical protein COLO4_04100 [Corchorus olitorius]|uniref:Uncharacterized protein n=1 Tax=Corchorus olitorius TaxID=93759 RepID=A0A1R3KV84_9ROSI|nr:hypothetical protein COLO4_04100 [Corchorus olitorius]
MLLGRSIYFLFRLLGLYSAFLWVSVICTLFSPIEGLSVGGGGASSSERPSFDLNLPPADEPEPAVEQGPIPLSQAEEKILFRLTQPAEPRNMGQLYVEARKIAQNKGELVDLMVELDRDAPDFWRHHRDDIISDSILTNRKTEYGSKVLSDMVAELRGERGCKCNRFEDPWFWKAHESERYVECATDTTLRRFFFISGGHFPYLTYATLPLQATPAEQDALRFPLLWTHRNMRRAGIVVPILNQFRKGSLML